MDHYYGLLLFICCWIPAEWCRTSTETPFPRCVYFIQIDSTGFQLVPNSFKIPLFVIKVTKDFHITNVLQAYIDAIAFPTKDILQGFGKIPAPINVIMDSFNFRNTLRWNRPADLEGNVTYTVQNKIDVESERVEYNTICVTHEHQCDSSMIDYKSYMRVNAQLNSNKSEWVTIYFDPYNQTIIGAPKIEVSSRMEYLDVRIDGPFVGILGGSLKEKYGTFIYRVVYWRQSDPANIFVVSTSLKADILHNLEAWTTYCVKVQVYVPEYDKAGEFSPEICKQTTEDSRTPSWKIAILFLGSMALATVFILLLIFVTFKAYKGIRYIFFPSYSFPQHLKEYLSRPCYSAPYLPSQPTEECGESCEQLTFVSEETEEKEAS